MSRKINLAAIRMDAAPAPTEQRLERAEALVARAASQKAQIAVLPEVFNTGYEYTDKNYALAEPMDGSTVSWMKSAARQHNLHLAGTLLLKETDGIYNTMLLISPEGKTWAYQKSYPWGWERAYFRPRKHPIQPAETEFGKIGMLICWDSGHANLWAAYAGKVDLMLVSSCPPRLDDKSIKFPDGNIISPRALGPLMNAAYRNGEKIFGKFFREQSAWLGVPSVNTCGSGVFHSPIPRARLSLAIFLAARPDLWKYIPQAEKTRLEAGYFDEAFIADAQGNVLTRAKLDGDDVAVAEVTLAGKTPVPQTPQPKIDLSPLTYRADELANALLVGYYEKRWKLT
ncbi:MAG: carbon-nitrogen hydrolase family protein [Anaerolineales bacterium]